MPEGMTASKWPFFLESELLCKCGCGRGPEVMDSTFMNRIVSMRRAAGFPFVVRSAYRCPEYNSRVSKTGLHGPHTTGHAMDIAVSGGAQMAALIRYAVLNGMTGYGPDFTKRYLHVDDLTEDDGFPRPNAWGYD